MTECSRMREFSDLRVLPWIKKTPSFGLIRSFQHHSRMTEWSVSDQNYCWMLSSHCNFHSFSFKSDMEWRNEVEWRGFRRRRKKWLLRCLSFRLNPSSRPHSKIQTKNLALDCPWNDVWMTLKWLNDIGMMEWHSNDGMPFKWLEWHWNDGMTLEWWNDIQMTGMTLEWWNDIGTVTDSFIETPFGSFHCHSVIPVSFKYKTFQYCSWNDVRMTEEWPRNERIRWCLL